MTSKDPAGPIRRAIEDAGAHTIMGTRVVGDRPTTKAERLPYECPTCGARYAGAKARDGCCWANVINLTRDTHE